MLLVCRIAGMAVCPPIAHDNRRSENSSYAEGSCRTGRPPQACWPTSGHEAEQAEALVAQRHAVDVLLYKAAYHRFRELLRAYHLKDNEGRLDRARAARQGLEARFQWTKRSNDPMAPSWSSQSWPAGRGYMAVASRAHQLVWPPSCSLVPKVGPRPHLVDTRHRWSVAAARWWARVVRTVRQPWRQLFSGWRGPRQHTAIGTSPKHLPSSDAFVQN